MTTTTASQDQEIVRRIVNGISSRTHFEQCLCAMLEQDCSNIVEWIASEFSPEEVFSPVRLIEWATDNGWYQPA